ncbi:hypothetical protein JCM14469_18320 [Desulfatiferula olefinivorans]
MTGPAITPTLSVLDVVAQWPETQDVFRRYDSLAGECICCNALFDTLTEMAHRYRLDLDRLLKDLEKAAGADPAT